jgi:predicted MPP superfamily phosphohydrolase
MFVRSSGTRRRRGLREDDRDDDDTIAAIPPASATLRSVSFLAIIAAVFLPLNIVAYRALVAIHPRRRPIFIALTILGNTMWPFFPILNARTDFSRFIRATLGPPWFAWQCFTFLYCAFLLLVFISRALAPSPTSSRARAGGGAGAPLSFKWASRIFLMLMAVGGLAGVWGCLVPLHIDRVPITLDDLPPSLDGKRIAIIGDLHVGLFSRSSRVRQIFETASALHPDVIVVAGDSIDDDPYFVPKLLASTRAADPSIPIVGVLGNHEMYGAPFEAIDKMRGGRIHLLVNEGLAVRGFWFAGLSDYAARDPRLRPNIAAALANRPPDAYPIVIAHQPKAFADARSQHVALTLCAHTHGGQLGIRQLRWTLAGLFVRYDIGLYREGGAQLYVHTGSGYWLLPFRLGITPEISLIELRANAATKHAAAFQDRINAASAPCARPRSPSSRS